MRIFRVGAAAGAALLVAAVSSQGQVSSDRRSPIVRAVERVSPSVVNISTEQRVENPFYPSALDRFFSSFWEGTPLDPGPPPGQPGGQHLQNSLGSGVLIDPRGYILTNEHVVWRASRVGVTLADRRRFEVEVVGVDPRSDLAVLKIEA